MKITQIHTFFFLCAIVFLSSCTAQEPEVHRVGVLLGAAPFAEVVEGFKARMTELGYVEGENIVYDFQKSDTNKVEMEAAIGKFVQNKVDLIFTVTHGAALAAKTGTEGTDIPTVFSYAITEEEGNLVASVRNPGGSLTGVRFPGPDLTVKRLEFLLDMDPEIKRVWVMYLSPYPAAISALKALRTAALSEEVTLVEVPVTDIEGMKQDLQSRTESGVDIDAIIVLPEPISHSPDGWKFISEFAAEHNIPVAGIPAFQASTGAVFSYVPKDFEVGQLAATQANKVLKGTPPGTIPVVTPESYLRLNYKLAQELGLTVDEGMLSLADEIIR